MPLETNILENNILENNKLEDKNETVQIDDSESKEEINKQLLSINNFANVKEDFILNNEHPSAVANHSNENNLEVLTNLPENNTKSSLLEGGYREESIITNIDNEEDKEEDKKEDVTEENTSDETKEEDEQKSNLLEDNSKEDHSENQGGGAISDGIVYEIDFLIADDKELIDITKVNNTVDKYINNFNSEELKKYKQSFKNLYQKYSNKRYIINNIGKVITVVKDEKKKDIHKNMKDMKNKDIVMELKKPHYLYYNNNGNLDILKMEISNDRVKLQYLYQTLVNKLNVSLDEKKDFEKRRKKFIESLETYYIYTLYHKKINKISTTNKVNIIIQELLGDNNLLESNIYSVDNSLIDLINKQNASKLNEFNNLVSKMQSIKNIKDDKKILETIKEYLNKNETNKLLDSIKLNAKQQDNYIDYIITELP